MEEYQESIAESLHEIAVTLKDISYWLEQIYISGNPVIETKEVEE